jgi:hypothetical protein
VETYPCVELNGYDVPCLHQLAYTVDPEADRDRGMVVHMLDAQRTYNNATNQQISWAQLALNPQIIGPPMANKIKFTDEPGAYYPVDPRQRHGPAVARRAPDAGGAVADEGGGQGSTCSRSLPPTTSRTNLSSARASRRADRSPAPGGSRSSSTWPRSTPS